MACLTGKVNLEHDRGDIMNNIILRRLFSVFAISFMFTLFSGEATAEKRIGILMFSEESFYVDSKKGILDQLKKDGFGEPAVKYTMENAEGSKAKAVELAQKLAAAKMDLIITFGTHATIAAVRAIKDVPIVFSTVYDPVEAGIAKDWKSSGNNTTGSSTKIPVAKLVNSLKEFAPVKRLAVLYTPGEKNSESQLMGLQQTQASSQIKVIPVILNKKEELTQTLSKVIPMTDAVYLTGSSIVSAAVPTIVEMTNKANIITMTHLDDLVEKGALLGVCINSYNGGRLAGKKAVQILKGAKPSSIPIEVDKKLDIILNMKTAKTGQFRIPPSFMKKVTKIME